eukprot:scaffold8204_cov177-Amphora_coffeaeformis.AAC.1
MVSSKRLWLDRLRDSDKRFRYRIRDRFQVYRTGFTAKFIDTRLTTAKENHRDSTYFAVDITEEYALDKIKLLATVKLAWCRLNDFAVPTTLEDAIHASFDRIITHGFGGGKLEEGHVKSGKYEPWGGNSAATGYDESGLLRCVTTQEGSSKGFDRGKETQKKHEELHEREQKKRLTWRDSGHKLNENNFERMCKYKSAAVGVMRQSKNVNDLFQVLRERGVRCKVVKDVDASLHLAAKNQ